MRLSIIVPTYNSEKTISKCLDSILAQSMSEFEIIVVDDGSNDSTVSIVSRYVDEHSNIVLLKQDNKGAAIARRNGVRISKGKYIGFVDSDDWIEKDMYYELYNGCENANADIAYCRLSFDYKDKMDIQRQLIKDKTILTSAEAIHVLHNRIGIEGSLCNKIFRRELLLKVRYPKKPIIQEDYVIVKQALEICKSVVCINLLGYHYVQHNGSSALSGYTELWDRAYYGYKRMLLETRFSNDKRRIIDIDNYMVNNFMWMILAMCENNNYDVEKIKWIQKFIFKRIPMILSNKNNTLLCKISALVIVLNYKLVYYGYSFYRRFMYVRV